MSDVLSIVVTIVGGGDYLRNFLHTLTRFTDAPELDVIVPYDDSVPDTAAMQAGFPAFRFLDLGHIDTMRPVRTEAGRHELYDRRRAAGLDAAKGSVIAILEDHGHPQPDWARTVMRLHQELPNGVIGGAIECQSKASLLNWALWVTDLGRYGRPFDQGDVQWVSDVNISYKRSAIEATRHLWKDRYHEPVVHWFIMEQGDTLYLSDQMVVIHKRPKAALSTLIPERFDWGRLFGYTRSQKLSHAIWLAYVLGSPAIPPVLWLRHGLRQRRKGNGLRYLVALPYVMLLTTIWTLGETWGTITRKP